MELSSINNTTTTITSIKKSNLPNYIIKSILNYYITRATSNLLVLETIYIISQICKEWKNNILPKLIYKKFEIRNENSFYQLFLIINQFNVDFQIILLNLEFWSNFKKYLFIPTTITTTTTTTSASTVSTSTSGENDEINFMNLNDNCNKELKIYFYQNIEMRKLFLNKFKDRVKSANGFFYHFELLVFRNLENITLFIDDEYPMYTFLNELENLFKNYENQNNNDDDNEDNGNDNGKEWINHKIRNITIFSDESIDFSNELISKFFKGLKSFQSLTISSHTSIKIRNLVRLIECQYGNDKFKRLYFKNCLISRDELYQLYEHNQTIEILNLNGLLENGIYNDAIIPLSNDSKIKEFTLHNDFPIVLKFSIIANVLNNNRNLTNFSIYTILSDDTETSTVDLESNLNNNNNNNNNDDGNGEEIVIFNDRLSSLGLLSKTDRILFEKGEFKNLKILKCSISEKVLKNLSKYNRESLEILLIFDTLDSSIETKKNFQLLVNGDGGSCQNNGTDYFGQFKNLKYLEVSLTEKSSEKSLDWVPLFKSITSFSLKSLVELKIDTKNPIEESMISQFFLSNHPTIKIFTLYLGYSIKDWSLILDPICRNQTIVHFHIYNSVHANDTNFNCTRSMIDIIQQNKTLQYLSFSIRDSISPYSQIDINDLSKSILENNTLIYLQLPYSLNRNHLIVNSLKYKLIKSSFI